MNRFRLLIPDRLFEEMLAHARSEYPLECCGLLAGLREDGIVTARYPLVNSRASETEFLSEPQGMFAAMRQMRNDGTTILAVYHSHPSSEPIPSRKDCEHRYADDVACVIIGMKELVTTRAWWLSEASYHEAEWQIINERRGE